MKTTCPKCKHRYEINPAALLGSTKSEKKAKSDAANGAMGGRPAQWQDAVFLQFFPKNNEKPQPISKIYSAAMKKLECSRSRIRDAAHRLMEKNLIAPSGEYPALWRRR